MSTRDENGKLAITPGKWEKSKTGLHLNIPSFKSRSYVGGASCLHEQMDYNSRLADVDLFLEAGTIANRYDATPSEMVETIRELRKALDVAGRHVAGLWVEESINNAMDKTAKYEEAE